MTMRLRGPADEIPGNPATPEAYLDHLAVKAFGRRRELVEDDRTIEAYYDFGRCIADCPFCRSGIMVHPEWSLAGCFGCFHVYRAIVVPADWRDIEEVLLERDLPNQAWLTAEKRTEVHGRGLRRYAAETLRDLAEENLDHGKRVPERIARDLNLPTEREPKTPGEKGRRVTPS